MSMYCFQCQESAGNQGCTKIGVCGKDQDVAGLQDLLIFLLKGISFYSVKARELGVTLQKADTFVMEQLFTTITNVNFNPDQLTKIIREAFLVRDEIRQTFLDAYRNKNGAEFHGDLPEAATWYSEGGKEEFLIKAQDVGILATENEDVRSLRELLIIGVKGIAAYAHHAHALGYSDPEVHQFMQEALASTTDDTLAVNDMISLVLKAGEVAVTVMALLDKANTDNYGMPEPTDVNIGVQDRPGILISGHDLRDLEELLEQTRDSGVDVYTHGEMLPAHAYPSFKGYKNFIGNYGNSWWLQDKEFESFNGPVLMTTNCLVPPKSSYIDRVYTTGVVSYPGVKHIQGPDSKGKKDFTGIIEHAKTCGSPQELETGKICVGFAHDTIMSVAPKIIDAVKSGAVKRFFVMAGCDGRFNDRSYYTELAQKLPEDTIILTAGCAKYRYNKLGLGDIGDIPRVIDAGQCNDSYSLAVVALKLVEAFEAGSINDLPISFDIAWYEQKAVTVLLALLHLGVKNIRIGPTLPAFLSPGVAKVLVETFDLKPISTVEDDIAAMMQGN